jgi:alpha-galactosidase
VDMSKPGAQEYYDSLMKLYAEWNVDFVKIDDLTRDGGGYHKAEVEAYRKAIDHCGRTIVFSTSPGATPVAEGGHISTHANMWRVMNDFWDNWNQLEGMFALLDAWTPYRDAGHWPDADMLPFGHVVRQNRNTRFSPDEQVTVMTLWCIGRSPLFFGGHLPDNDEFTNSLITNEEVIAVNQHSTGNRQLYRHEDRVAWIADVPGSKDRYLALFNLSDKWREIFRSDLVTRETSGQSVEIAADVSGAKKLYLLIEDGGDGFACDHADWLDPRLTGPNGELKLTDLKWKSANAGWGHPAVGKSVSGKQLMVNGKMYENGIGTHSVSVIEYELPDGYTKFTARGGLDEGGVKQNSPGATVRFIVARDGIPKETTVKLSDLGFSGPCHVRDLWSRKDFGQFTSTFSVPLPSHGAGLYRISSVINLEK